MSSSSPPPSLIAELTRLPLATTVPVATVVFVVAYLVVGGITNYRKLRQFKGPPLAAWTKCYMAWQSLRARLSYDELKAVRKYGSLCRYGPDLLLTNDVELIRLMNAPKSTFTRSKWYTAMRLDPRKDTVFSTRDEGVHAELRAKMLPGYYGRDIDNIEPDVGDRVKDLLHLVRTRYSGKSMELALVSRLFTMDVLSTVAFGAPFGYLKANKDIYGYTDANEQFLPLLELSLNHDSWHFMLTNPIVQWLVAPRESDGSGLGPIVRVAREAVAKRFEPNAEKKRDMLGLMIEKGLSQEQCKAEANLQILAGSDSTTTTLQCCLFEITHSPATYMRLRAEVDNAVASGKATRPLITYAEAKELPYLHACLWETLRMWPPLFGHKTKRTPREGFHWKGVFIPGNIDIGQVDDGFCRDPAIFGADADIWRPDRWIEADSATRERYLRTVDTIFGSGRFMCLGKHIAMVELHLAIFEMMRNFDFQVTNSMKGVRNTRFGVNLMHGLDVIPYPRQH